MPAPGSGHPQSRLRRHLVIRTSEAKEDLSAEKTVETYKSLAKVERAFRCLKGVDLHVRLIHHRRADRVKAPLFVCILGYYIEWHLRQTWAEPLWAAEEDSVREMPMAPTRPSAAAIAKKSIAHSKDGLPLQTFRGPLQSLGTLACRRIFLGENGPLYSRNTKPSALQARAVSSSTSPSRR